MMRRFAISRVFWFGLLILTRPVDAAGEPASGATPAVDTGTAAARGHYARGVAFYEQRAYAQALAEFQRAYSLVPNPKLRFSMGQAHAGLGRYAAAITELQAYVDSVGGSVPDERRLQVERQLEAFRARVGQIVVTVNVAGATIEVDGEVVGTSPLPRPLLLDEGPHRVAASRHDHSSESARVSVFGGELTPVRLALQPVVLAERSELATPLWVAAVLCGALAVGSGIVALNHRRNYDRSLEQTREGDAAAIHHAFEQQRSRVEAWLLATDILMGVTAATGVAAIYLSVRGDDVPERNDTALRALGVSATVRGQF
jgi:hypothetical protein